MGAVADSHRSDGCAAAGSNGCYFDADVKVFTIHGGLAADTGDTGLRIRLGDGVRCAGGGYFEVIVPLVSGREGDGILCAHRVSSHAAGPGPGGEGDGAGAAHAVIDEDAAGRGATPPPKMWRSG